MLPHSHFYSFRHPALHSQRWCSTRVPRFLQWNIGLSALGFAPGACWPSWAGMTAPKFRPAVASRRRFRMGCSQVLGRLGGGTRLSTLAGRSAPRFSPTTVAFAIASDAVQDRCLRPMPASMPSSAPGLRLRSMPCHACSDAQLPSPSPPMQSKTVAFVRCLRHPTRGARSDPTEH
jgi:hypothetical protein